MNESEVFDYNEGVDAGSRCFCTYAGFGRSLVEDVFVNASGQPEAAALGAPREHITAKLRGLEVQRPALEPKCKLEPKRLQDSKCLFSF